MMRDGRVASVAYTWTIDTAAPAAPNLAGTSESWRAGSQDVSLTDAAADVHHYVYQVNGGAKTRGSRITVASEGTTTISAVAVDKAGNMSPQAAGHVKLDNVAPGVPELSNVGASLVWHNDPGLTVTPWASDPDGSGVDHYLYQLNGGAERTLLDGEDIAISDSGVTSISVVAVDGVGNRSAPATGEVGLDALAPQVTTPNLPTLSQQIGVDVADLISEHGGSGLAGALWKVRAAGSGIWSPPHQIADDPVITAPGDGNWEFFVRAWDNAGNVTDVQFTAGQDSSPPPAPYIYGGTGSAPVASPVPMGVRQCCDDPESGLAGRWQYEISNDGGATWSVPIEYTAAFTPTDPGTYEMRARAQNMVGLWSDWSVPGQSATETFAPPVPAVPFVTGGHGTSPDNTNTVVFQWAAVTDPANPGYQVQYQIQQRLNGGPWQDVFTVPYPGFIVHGSGCLLSEVRIRALGSSGYWSDWSQVTDASTDRLCG
jgi:hypothetical protein